jgi:hypothetical protein
VVLAVAIGFMLEAWMRVPDATAYAVALGMLVALFVPPGNRSCPIR